jgi:hypothetical protein
MTEDTFPPTSLTADQLRAQLNAPAPQPLPPAPVPATEPAAGPLTADQLRAQFSSGPAPTPAPVMTMEDLGPVSQTALDMVAAGARPTEIDGEALLRELRRMQARIASLEGERGVPSDPIAGGIANLQAHVKARAAQYPDRDFSELLTVLGRLPDSASVTPAHSDLVKTIVDEVTTAAKHLELSYLPELAGALHKAVLAGVTHGFAAGL